MFKTCVSIYSFGSYCRSDKWGIEKILEHVRESGFDGVEFVDKVQDFALTEENVARIASICEKLALPVVNLCTGADFVTGSGGDTEAEIEKLRRTLDIAARLGTPLMRHDVSGGFPKAQKVSRGYDDALERMAYGCGAVTEYAKTLGIVTCTENHGYFSQDSERVEKLINKVGNENFGALLDTGNFACADDDPVHAVGILAPYARHVHLKDAHIKSGKEINPGRGWSVSRGGTYIKWTIFGHGDLGVCRSLRALDRAGFDGYASIEFEGMEDNISAIGIGLENLKRFIKYEI